MLLTKAPRIAGWATATGILSLFFFAGASAAFLFGEIPLSLLLLAIGLGMVSQLRVDSSLTGAAVTLALLSGLISSGEISKTLIVLLSGVAFFSIAGAGGAGFVVLKDEVKVPDPDPDEKEIFPGAGDLIQIGPHLMLVSKVESEGLSANVLSENAPHLMEPGALLLARRELSLRRTLSSLKLFLFSRALYFIAFQTLAGYVIFHLLTLEPEIKAILFLGQALAALFFRASSIAYYHSQVREIESEISTQPE